MLKKAAVFLSCLVFLKTAYAYKGAALVIHAGIFSAGANISFLQSQHILSRTSSEKLDWPGLGFSASVTTETRFFSDITSIGFELGYLRTKASFHSNDFMGSIPEVTHYLKNNIMLNQLALPVYLKAAIGKEDNEFYAFGGVGIKYLFLNRRQVDRVSFNMNSPDEKTVTPVLKGRFGFTNGKNTGGLFLLGIGKNFALNESSISVELRYMQDLKTWNYPITYNGIEETVPVRLETISLRLVYAL